MATPIHDHTDASALDGLSRPRELVEVCQTHGFTACGCTDHGSVAGHIAFYDAMVAGDIKPLLGMEAYQANESAKIHQRDNHHLVLIAKNNIGLRNLWALSTEGSSNDRFYFVPRLDWELLEKYHEGLICTSACMGGILSQSLTREGLENAAKAKILEGVPTVYRLLQRFKSIFGDDFYVELHTYGSDDKHWVERTDYQAHINQDLGDLAKEFGIPLVYANDAHYATPEQYELHESISKIRSKNDEGYKHPPCLYVMSEQEVRHRLSYLDSRWVDEAVRNSDLIASQCDVSLPERRNRVPIFLPDKGYRTNRDMFDDLVIQAFTQFVHDNPDRDRLQYAQRMADEVKVMKSVPGMVDYFLIVRDYIHAARKMGVVVGPGRGSSGGSLVAFLLGITKVDPIRYGLIFERFYNAGRESSLPDIDTDFDPVGREKVKKYVAQKYGVEQVADLGTVTKMGPKLAIKDMGRVLRTSFPDLKAINEILDETVESGLWDDWDVIWEKVGDKLEPYRRKNPKLFEWAAIMNGYTRTFGVHASAVIVADKPLADTFPLRYIPKDDKLASQWDMRVAERFGYMKMDFLGLKNLAILQEVNSILKDLGREAEQIDLVDWSFQYDEHPEAMWEILDRGATTGIFQVEEGGMARHISKHLKIRSLEDLAFMTALNRPGVLHVDAHERAIAVRKGQAEPQRIHPLLDAVAEPTMGEIVYQEQVIQFCVNIGYTLQEADGVRAIMGKKKREKLEEEHPRFIERATQHMGQELAESIWETLMGFASYAFNKAHSVEYGLISMGTLVAKYYFPEIFILAGLRVELRSKKKDLAARWISDALRQHIGVLPPLVNAADTEPALLDGAIVLGLTNIKGVGAGPAKWIVKHRPYESFEDFQVKTQTYKYQLPNGRERMIVHKGHCESLVNVGAFKEVDPSVSPQLTLEEQIEVEEALLGVALSDDSEAMLERKSDLLDRTCVPISIIDDPGIYYVAGVIREIEERTTKTQKPYLKVRLQRGPEDISFYIWQDKMLKYASELRLRNPVVVELRKTSKGINLLRLHPVSDL